MSGTTSGVLFKTNGTDTDMVLYRGKSLNFEVVWGGPAPIDITGYQASLHVRDYVGRLLMELSTANGQIVNGGVSGKLNFLAPPVLTRTVNAPGTYEVEMTAPTGEVYRVISGKVSIEEEVVL